MAVSAVIFQFHDFYCMMPC